MADPVPLPPTASHDAALAAAQAAANTLRAREQRDRARASGRRVTLICVSEFTLHGEDIENCPDGRVVRMGEEFEVDEFDLPRYAGRGMPATMYAPGTVQRGQEA